MKMDMVCFLLLFGACESLSMEPKEPTATLSDYSAESDIESPEVENFEVEIIIAEKAKKSRCYSLYCAFNCFLKNKVKK